MTSSEATAPTLQIQTVFYKLQQFEVDRFLRSTSQAALLAKRTGAVSRVVLAIGDCSPLPVLRREELDDLRAVLVEAGVDELSYEFFDANLGSAEGHNRLFRTLDSDMVLIMNPDAVASPHLIQELMLRLNDPRIGLVEGRQIPIEHPKHYDPVTGETSWATTACALIPRSVVEEIGDFDSSTFFLYCDDVDYSWRIRLAGYKVIFHPPARIFHDKRLDSMGRMVVGSAEEYYAAEASLMMVHKWSRPDLVELYLEWLRNGTELQRKAAAEFERRRTSGQLPDPLDPDHVVGEFPSPGHWTKHRW